MTDNYAVGVASSLPVVYLASSPDFRRLFGLSTPGSVWRLLAVLFALLNLKSLPSAWHVSTPIKFRKDWANFSYSLLTFSCRSLQIRLLRSLLTHITFRGTRPYLTPSTIFTPIITVSYTSPLECDYNLHKSNSTYFSDLDVSRSHLLSCLLARGIEKARSRPSPKAGPDGKNVEGKLGVFLGGVTCSFRKEIKPFEGFEIWTRVLAWDRKWVYLVSHIVKKGKVRPKSYILQPWRKGSKAVPSDEANGAPNPAICATSIAKYVFKKGRLTIPPEEVLKTSELLPEKPNLEPTPPYSETPTVESASAEIETASTLRRLSGAEMVKIIDKSLNPPSEEEWDWDRVEKERAKGMEIAVHMARLDDLHGEFTAGNQPAFGQY